MGNVFLYIRLFLRSDFLFFMEFLSSSILYSLLTVILSGQIIGIMQKIRIPKVEREEEVLGE